MILPVSNLYEGGDKLEKLDKEYNIQISKRKGYGDLKKRLVDVIKANFLENITENDIRLWKFSDTKERLVESC